MSDYKRIYDQLQPLGYPQAAVLYPSDGNMPDTCLVVGQVAATDESHFSNRSTRENRRYDVSIYTRDGNALERIVREVREAMSHISLFVAESGDLFYKESGHFARVLDFRIYHEK